MVVNDGNSSANQTVEQRRLSNIRPANDRDARNIR